MGDLSRPRMGSLELLLIPELPTSIASATFTVFGVEVRCHVLSDGQRVIDAESAAALFEAMAADEPMGDMESFAQWIKAQRVTEQKGCVHGYSAGCSDAGCLGTKYGRCSRCYGMGDSRCGDKCQACGGDGFGASQVARAGEGTDAG